MEANGGRGATEKGGQGRKDSEPNLPHLEHELLPPQVQEAISFPRLWRLSRTSSSLWRVQGPAQQIRPGGWSSGHAAVHVPEPREGDHLTDLGEQSRSARRFVSDAFRTFPTFCLTHDPSRLSTGHMESAVEQLLVLDTSASPGPQPTEPATQTPTTPPQAKPPQKATPTTMVGAATSSPPAGALPRAFLQPPSYFIHLHNAAHPEAPLPLQTSEQDLQDRLLVDQLIQDELFARALLQHPEWFEEGEAEEEEADRKKTRAPAAAGEGGDGKSGTAMKEKFASLGASAKNRLRLLASKMRRATTTTSSSASAASSTSSASPSGTTLASPLLDGDMDESKADPSISTSSSFWKRGKRNKPHRLLQDSETFGTTVGSSYSPPPPIAMAKISVSEPVDEDDSNRR